MTAPGRCDVAVLGDGPAGAAAAGVRLVAAMLRRAWRDGDGWRIAAEGDDGPLCVAAAVLIEARGRRAPAGGRRRRGPATTALTQRWQLADGAAPGFLLEPFADGWAWLARGADGTAGLQLVVDSAALPGRAGLAAFAAAQRDGLPRLRALLRGGRPDGPLVARDATPTLSPWLAEPGRLRLGDAAAAIDPLSGHGLFLALAAALAAPAVVNTLLQRPADAPLAAAFHRERVEEAFWRHARSGRDLYRQEQRWCDSGFWSRRRAWPDDAAAHPAREPAGAQNVAVVRRPVLAGDYIVAREVVVSAEQPRGIWRLDGVELAPAVRLARRLGDAPRAQFDAALAQATGASRPQLDSLIAWLARHDLMERVR